MSYGHTVLQEQYSKERGKPDDDPSSSCWCSMMADARMGSLGRVLAWVIPPRPWGEEEPRAAPGLPTVLPVLPGKAALTNPDGVNLCDATQFPVINMTFVRSVYLYALHRDKFNGQRCCLLYALPAMQVILAQPGKLL